MPAYLPGEKGGEANRERGTPAGDRPPAVTHTYRRCPQQVLYIEGTYARAPSTRSTCGVRGEAEVTLEGRACSDNAMKSRLSGAGVRWRTRPVPLKRKACRAGRVGKILRPGRDVSVPACKAATSQRQVVMTKQE